MDINPLLLLLLLHGKKNINIYLLIFKDIEKMICCIAFTPLCVPTGKRKKII